MANTFLTIDMITRKALEVLENSLVLTRTVNRQYDSSFAQSGAKIGDTLRIRLPDRTLVTDGPALQVQAVNQQKTTLTVSSQKHIDFSFTTADMALKIDDFTELFIKPRISQLAASVDADVANAFKYAGQSVGTPGTTPSTSWFLLQGQQKLNESAAPMGNRYAVVNPAANAALVEGMKGFFNPVDAISKQFRNGMMADNILGYDEVAMSQSIANHTNGPWGTTITVGSTVTTQGSTSIVLNYTGTSKQWKQGDVFTVAGVYAVNPQTRLSTGSLYQFVVAADSAVATSTVTVTVAPMYTASQALATIDAFPQSGAVVTMYGSAATAYPQNLIYHRDAIAFATADLPLPANQGQSSRATHNGLSVRLIKDYYDVQNDQFVTRMDILYGYGVIRPELLVRGWG